MIITMRDVRRAKMCARGAREFCRTYDIDWSAFLKNGVDDHVILNTNDAAGRRVVEVARGRQQ